jgi:hypothetical protein
MLMIIIMLPAAAGTERDTGPAKLIIKSDRFPQRTLKVSHGWPPKRNFRLSHGTLEGKPPCTGWPGKGISARVTAFLKVSHLVPGGPEKEFQHGLRRS